MELETEELLRKWLKLQLFKERLNFIFRLLALSFFVISLLIVYTQVLPFLKAQMEKTSVMKGMSELEGF